MKLTRLITQCFVGSALCFSIASFKTIQTNKLKQNSDTITLADPTIFHQDGKYYLYGTGNKNGFAVYTSNNLKQWQKANNLALKTGDAYGTYNFWAPQVVFRNGRYYIAYAANEHIAIAQGDSPLGPFKQTNLAPIAGESRQIDPFIFTDDDGKNYLYYVRVQGGNRIFVAELNNDLTDIKPETAKECVHATETWENTQNAKWPVTEGPTVLKHKGLYYLFYSANDFRNIDYSVGYAVADNPYGPWKKYSGNPIISRHNMGYNGTGHGDFFTDGKNNLYYVLHTHKSQNKVSPRLTAVVKAAFVKDGKNADKVVIDSSSFSFLTLK